MSRWLWTFDQGLMTTAYGTVDGLEGGDFVGRDVPYLRAFEPSRRIAWSIAYQLRLLGVPRQRFVGLGLHLRLHWSETRPVDGKNVAIRGVELLPGVVLRVPVGHADLLVVGQLGPSLSSPRLPSRAQANEAPLAFVVGASAGARHWISDRLSLGLEAVYLYRRHDRADLRTSELLLHAFIGIAAAARVAR